MKTLYTVSRCRKDNALLYGKKHGADNDNQTVCGLDLSIGYWWIIPDPLVCVGDIDCKKCLKVLKDHPTIPERMGGNNGLATHT